MEIEYIYYYPFLKDIDIVDIETEVNDSNFYTIIMIYRELVKKYKDYKISIKNIAYEKNKDYRYKDNFNCGIFIRNKQNNKYLYISQCDSIGQFYGSVNSEDIKNCVEIFCKVGVHEDHLSYAPYRISKDEYVKYTPISHTHDQFSSHKIVEENYKRYKIKDLRSIPKLPVFMGVPYGIRTFFKDSKVIRYYDTQNKGKVLQKTFIDILNRYSINVDINSVAEISTRSLEIMGLGSALIRPKLTIQYHNPLIPNYHYIAIDCDQRNIEDLKLGYQEAFEMLKKDKDLRVFISENGRKWYEENCHLENYIKIIFDRLDLDKLK